MTRGHAHHEEANDDDAEGALDCRTHCYADAGSGSGRANHRHHK